MRKAFFVVLLASAATEDAAAQDIVVTGERRAARVMTLAGNTARMTGEELAFVAPQVASEALNRLPGVAIHRNNGVENLPAIRSPVLTGGQSAGSFLVLEDGVPIRAPGFSNVNAIFETSLDFAEAVEVVRGPGSALYGSNAVHGIVNVSTHAPGRSNALRNVPREAFAGSMAVDSQGRRSGALAARLGRNQWDFAPACPGAAPDDIYFHCRYSTPLRGFLGASFTQTDGPRTQSGLDEQSALLGLAWNAGNWAVDLRFVAQNLNQETAGFIEGARAFDSDALARSNPTPEAFRDQQLARARLTLSRDFGDWQLRITPYARWIDTELLLSFFPSRALETSGQDGAGVQSALYWDPNQTISLIVGADADLGSGRLREFQARETQPNGYVQGLHYDYRVDMDALAAFAQARWRFAEDWSLTAGVRGESVRYDYDNLAPDGDLGRFRRVADRADDFDALSPKLGLVWNPDADQAIYLNLARGARPPQITDLYSLQTQQTPGAQGVETLDSAELGWRGAFESGEFEAALYHMDKRDTSFRNADGFTVTDGASRHQGVELSAALQLNETIDVSGWLSYARHSYRFDDVATREVIRSGAEIDTAPRWLWNGRFSWRPVEALGLELEWVHMGRYFTNAENTRTYPGHDIFNLRAEWRADETVTLFAAVRNLANTDYAERADFAFGADRYFPGQDRGLTLGLRAAR